MARGKYLSLEEARKQNTLDRFCKEHPSRGNWSKFDKLMDSFVGPEAKRTSRAVRTSSRERGANSSETRTRQGTSEDASG